MLSVWQMEAMQERAAEEEWERLNAPDPLEDKLQQAAEDLKGVLDNIWEAQNSIGLAQAELTGTPMECKLESLIDELEAVSGTLRELKEHWERGERE